MWDISRNINNDYREQNLEEFISDLVNRGLLKEEEKNEILSTGKITIGSRNIVFKKYTYISNKEELEEFRDSVNNGYTYKDETVVLVNDIDLGGIKSDTSTWWIPIGSNEYSIYFEGTFEGNNYAITNIYNKECEGEGFIAFFSAIKDATIKNLIVQGELVIGEKVSSEDDPTASGVIGVSYGNCQIINCVNEVNVSKSYATREVAGILVCVERGSNTNIYNCVNKGDFSGGNGCGGIVGTVYGTVMINNCYNEGNIGDLVSQYVGGIIARAGQGAEMVTVNNSYNKGNLTSRRYIAGILGYSVSGDILVNNCYNEGTINITNRSAIGYAGGIIGRAIRTSGKMTIINSYNIQNIILENETYNVVLGGIMGETDVDDASIINCYNLGNLEGDYTSGICGLISTGVNPNLSIINSYNKGNVSGRMYESGIVRIHVSTATVDIQNVYYLNTTAQLGVQNAISDETIPLDENHMKSESFVNDLNNNLLSIGTDIELNEWKYIENDYPVFR